MENIQQQVADIIEQDASMLPAAIAAQLNVSEFEVVRSLPKEMATLVEGIKAQQILESLVGFGPVTTIVQAGGSIFEVKAPFPKGKVARGYYNLMGEAGQLHGHLKVENMVNVALISKPFMGMDSHYFGFFDAQGDSIFKVYLGRDEQRKLIPEQVSMFEQWKLDLV
ncbi:heme utilization cystosolic carrier protein HutX [Vibrio intestinalis]|uniref:heme utilization cystosolic carrier protein HutX n=1 Tax=Vibrio intestinalis TaxID=2933291 RepID=UPI0021A28D5A|nr:heme utilization cystosolic carrier protein HutX [Vibrio intestinalis]